MKTRDRAVQRANSYIGMRQGDARHRKLVDTYNSYLPHPRGYIADYDDWWCAMTMSAIAIDEKLTDIMPVECGCPQQIEWYKQKGRWQERDDYNAQPGDVIYWDWQDNGVGDNHGNPDHVGMVVENRNGNLKIVEGNNSQVSCGYTNIRVNARYIRGYGLPDYEKKDGPRAKDAIDISVENAVKDCGLDSPGYWEDVMRGRRIASAANIKALVDKYHAALMKK